MLDSILKALETLFIVGTISVIWAQFQINKENNRRNRERDDRIRWRRDDIAELARRVEHLETRVGYAPRKDNTV
jgi:hypothetical protein